MAVGSSAVTGVGDSGNRELSCRPAWQPGTLSMGPSGILSWILAKASPPVFPAGRVAVGERAFGWQGTSGWVTATTLSLVPVPGLGAAVWEQSRAVQRGWLIPGLTQRTGHPSGASGSDTGCDTAVSAATPLTAAGWDRLLRHRQPCSPGRCLDSRHGGRQDSQLSG